MAYQLRIQSGANKGRIYDLKPGSVLGRSGADIPLDDPKVSNKHAKIETSEDGAWLVVDLGSTNGIKVNGKRQSRVTIVPGLVVKIGNSVCEFIEFSTVGWPEYLSNFSKSCKEKGVSRNKGNRLVAFKPILILTITKGPQAGTEWTLGYGPRQVGRAALDLHLMDPSAPDLVCTLSPKGVSAFFETAHPDKVRLNGRSISSETLKAGDEIQVAESTLRVSYEE